jgi:hypothetical protein
MKYTEAEYLSYPFFEGDMDVTIQNYKAKIVKCRKPHKCWSGCGNEIKAGDMAMYESGFDDGEPVGVHTCIPCLDKWIDEINGIEDGDDT